MSGVEACEKAFERLKAGNPHISAHVGIEREKITAGVVSVEAGFDRGYLKKSRTKHQALIAKIDAYKNLESKPSGSLSLKYRRAKAKIVVLETELLSCKATMHKVLSQNLQLVETIRRLEVHIKTL